MKKLRSWGMLLCLVSAILSGCSGRGEAALKKLPASEPDSGSMFGVDTNVNMDTIDDYLGRDDVEYIDVRMLFDPADYAAIGGEANLTRTIHGFKVVPYPYLASLSELPVTGAYEGTSLYELAWDENGEVVSAAPNYEESKMILEELFPKDKVIFLMCGGGGYSGMTKSLLIYLGWEESLLYNIGANWTYTGDNALELVVYPEDANGNNIYATWRVDYAYIDFSRLNPVGGNR